VSSSSRFPASSAVIWDKPVTLPPGRARVSTNPLATGSPAATITIGIVLVAFWAASAAHGERMDTRAADTARAADPAMASLGVVDGTEDSSGKGASKPER